MAWTPEEEADYQKSIEWRADKSNTVDDSRDYVPGGLSGHYIACAGEFQMCVIEFGGKPNSEKYYGGDGGKDINLLFRQRWMLTDVKTAYVPNELLVGAAKQKDGTTPKDSIKPNTIYVLAGYIAPRKAWFRGWQMGHVIAKCEVVDWCNNGRLVHHMPAEELRPMEELKRWYDGQWRHDGHKRYSQPQPADYTMDYEVIRGVLVPKQKSLLCCRAGIEMTKEQWMALPADLRARYWKDTSWGTEPASLAMADEVRQAVQLF